MPKYKNGQIPQNVLVKVGSGNNADGYWEHLLPPSTARKHHALVALAQKRTGRLLQITPGWNGYRPLHIQVQARQRHGTGAADPGFSSHGGDWAGPPTGWKKVDTAAIDYGNWAGVYQNHGGQAAFFADQRAVGLTPGGIMRPSFPNEPWHSIDLDPWAPVPASTPSQEEDDMFTDADRELLRNATAGKGGVQFYERVKADGTSDGEWMIVDPSYGLLAPGSLQDGYRVTTDINQARIWGRQIAGVSTRPVHLIRDLYIAQQEWARSRAAEWRASILAIVKEAVAGIPVATATPAAECKCPPAVTVDTDAIAAAVRTKFATDPLK